MTEAAAAILWYGEDKRGGTQERHSNGHPPNDHSYHPSSHSSHPSHSSHHPHHPIASSSLVQQLYGIKTNTEYKDGLPKAKHIYHISRMMKEPSNRW